MIITYCYTWSAAPFVGFLFSSTHVINTENEVNMEYIQLSARVTPSILGQLSAFDCFVSPYFLFLLFRFVHFINCAEMALFKCINVSISVYLKYKRIICSHLLRKCKRYQNIWAQVASRKCAFFAYYHQKSINWFLFWAHEYKKIPSDYTNAKSIFRFE